ncbi:MAG: DUF1887 family protein [Lachnospiraceae bacterium]|nr:DUF1887 family protein [Lachnospiraceae bacterium]
MRILIEFFDNTILRNMTGVMSVRPDIAAFFYDRKTGDHRRVTEVCEACKKYVPDLKYELINVDMTDVAGLENRIRQYVAENYMDEIIMDITGGNDLSHFASYHVGREEDLEIIYADIAAGKLRSFGKGDSSFGQMHVDLETLVTGVQGKVISSTSDHYLERNREALRETAKVLLSNISQWSQACYYFQKKMETNRENGSLHFRNKGVDNVPSKKIMYAFADNELIRDLTYDNARLEFTMKDSYIRDSLTTYGVWLELYTYYAAQSVKEFTDVRTSVKIDWYRKDMNENVDNEIDVTAVMGLKPVIISCKSSEKSATAEALNELYVVSRRLGGDFAEPALVTMANTTNARLGLKKKGREMGIAVIGEDEILSKDFPGILLRKISENKKGIF